MDNNIENFNATTYPLISIIVPFYNVEQYIELTIKSVLSQTYSNWELFLFDDGSTDASLSIARKFFDDRIKVFSDGHNLGRPRRLNEAIEQASGNYIARLDADDAFFPEKLQRQMEFLLNNPDVDVLGTFAIAIDNHNNLVGAIRQPVPDNYETVVVTGSCFIHPSIIAKSKWFRENKYNEDIKRTDDFELWVRTYRKSNFQCIKQPLLFYRNTGVMAKWKYAEGLKDVKNIMRLHKNTIRWTLRAKSIFRAYIKIRFYELVVKLNLLNKIFPMSTKEKNEATDNLRIIQGWK